MSTISDLTEEGQVLLRGVLHGGLNVGGSPNPIQVKSRDLFGRPDIAQKKTQRNDRGTQAGIAREGSIAIAGEVWLNAWPDMEQMVDDAGRIAAAWRPQVAVDQLDFYAGGSVWTYFGRALGVDLVEDDNTDVWAGDWSFSVDDPRRFGPEQSVTLTDEDPETIETDGYDTGAWRWSVVGPCIIPALSIDDWTLAYGGNVGSGQTLVVSSRLRTATLDGADVSGAMYDGTSRRQRLIQFPQGGAEVTFDSHGGATTCNFKVRGGA